MEPLLAAKAKEKELERKTTLPKSAKSKSPPINTRKELSKISGLSGDTISKAKLVLERADERTLADVMSNKVSINKAASDIRREDKKIEHAQKIEKAAQAPERGRIVMQE